MNRTTSFVILILQALTREAAIFSSAVAEYMGAELLELSGNAARDTRSIAFAVPQSESRYDG